MQYIIIVGETGNEIGHPKTRELADDDAAIAYARRAVSPYGQDGWYIVKDDRGQTVAKGGRFNF